MGLVAAEAVPFEDFIDGYFPLGLSLRHLLNRRGFAAAWIVMLVAPMMEIPSLDPKDSVPLHIDPAHGGQIDWLSATIRCVGQSVRLSGCAIWDWYDPARSGHDAPSAATRLAEPAFIRGIGFLPGDVRTHALGAVRAGSGTSDVWIAGQCREGDAVRPDRFCWKLSATNNVVRFCPEEMHRETPGRISGNWLEGLILSDDGDHIMSRIISDAQIRTEALR